MTKTRTSPGVLSPVLSVFAALLVSAVLILAVSKSPGETLRAFFTVPFRSGYHLGNLLQRSSGILLTGLGICIAFRGGMFNLGGEGQVLFSAVSVTVFLRLFSGMSPVMGGILGIAGAVLTGAFLAGVSGFMKYRWNADELITSFLLSGSLIPLADFLILGPLKDETSYLIATKPIPGKFALNQILPPSLLDISFPIALGAAVLVYVFLFRTLTGYELRMFGANRKFSAFGGVRLGKFFILTMVLSGAFHGLAGAFSVMGGRNNAAVSGLTAGMGWNGIAVALIGRNHPLLAVPAALIFSFLESGAQAAVLTTDFSFRLDAVIRGVVFLFITVSYARPGRRT
ncbi:MAG: ABC transporter permease [Spirochaetia bacterium]